MRYADDDRFTDLDTAKRGSRPRRTWTGSLGQRAQASRRLPQAVFKISSYSRSAGAVMGRFEYITREGELEAEGPNGERLDQAALAGLVDEWSEEAAARHTQRQAMSAVLSFPAAVDQEKATETARQFFREAFADNHDYVFAAHRDTDHFHVHVVVQAAGHDGKQLRIGRPDIQDLRLLMAEKAAEQGIELDASPRWARGLEKERPPGPKLDGLMRRTRSPEQVFEGAVILSAHRRTQLEALVEERRDRDPDAATVTPLEYTRAAERVAATISELETGPAKVRAMKAAVGLALDGLALTRSPRTNEADAGAAAHVAAQVDKALAAQIRDLPDDTDPALKREAWSARNPLADRLAAARPAPERRWAREAPEQQADGRDPASQALEYARSAGGVAVQIATLKNDPDRVAAIKGAVSLARFGWELTERANAAGAEQEQARGKAREIIDKTERAIREEIQLIEDPQAQREAIQERAALYHAGVKEYRAARREQEWQRRQEAEREEGLER